MFEMVDFNEYFNVYRVEELFQVSGLDFVLYNYLLLYEVMYIFKYDGGKYVLFKIYLGDLFNENFQFLFCKYVLVFIGIVKILMVCLLVCC